MSEKNKIENLAEDLLLSMEGLSFKEKKQELVKVLDSLYAKKDNGIQLTYWDFLETVERAGKAYADTPLPVTLRDEKGYFTDLPNTQVGNYLMFESVLLTLSSKGAFYVSPKFLKGRR